MAGLFDDYFSEYINQIPEDKRFRQTPLSPEEAKAMNDYLYASQWLTEIQGLIGQESGALPDRRGLLGELMQGDDYDYAGAWKSRGPEMFGQDPGTGEMHGYSKTPEGQWLKSPHHETAWKEIFWNEGGFTPDTPWDSPHPSLTRGQASNFMYRNPPKK